MSLLDEISAAIQHCYNTTGRDPQCIYLQRHLWHSLVADINDALQVEVTDCNEKFFGMMLVLVEHPDHQRVRVI
jgi:hypothetical protein